MEKESVQKPSVFDSETSKEELLAFGYVRRITAATNVILPDDVTGVIHEYSKTTATLLRFDEIVDPKLDKYWTFNTERTLATKTNNGVFWNVMGHVPDYIDTSVGIHYFRLKIENPGRNDMLWGISLQNINIIPPSYSSKYVYGWQVYGQRVEGNQRIDDKRYNFMGKYSSLILDMKLDCDGHKLSFIPIKLNEVNDGSDPLIGQEFSITTLPTTLPTQIGYNNVKGWVPHFQAYYKGTSISIAHIPTESDLFYGKPDVGIDTLFNNE